ncbi:MAG: DsrE family protein [Proteobacteria bacterium]|nr:DsrE family protein [Pseudomonadota bacterium]MBU1451511.1 DsrE family protein [Pseudomonadota bacterium]MBU2470454.1 DsrE family protein [Pseudomonadota bacterium]MBU2519015.1 DsrE family protein [Pseudomonadota bacterium]
MDKAADTLVIIWSSRDREVAKNMVFMYAKNSRLKGWWPAVRLVVWGPSASLIAEDAELQTELEELRQAGVELLACRACADKYGVAPRLEELGIEVIYMGQPLTEYLRAGLPVLTF